MDVVEEKTQSNNNKNKPIPSLKDIQPTSQAFQKAIRELTHANLRLRQLDKAKDEFISIASHELRNPMSIIKGNISIILSGDMGVVNTEVRDILTDMLVAVERQIRLVNELLDVSKIEAGSMNFRLNSTTQMQTVAELLVNSIKVVADPNITIQVNKPERPLPPVQADQDKVSQVLINLVTNSMKFTKKGSIVIDFFRKEDIVVTCVKDTGIGIPEKQRDLLFKKFSKPASTNIGTISAGSGLGLYISKKFIQKQGGDVWLEKSGPEVGSTFCFSLPIANSEKARQVEKQINSIQSLKGGVYEQNIINRR